MTKEKKIIALSHIFSEIKTSPSPLTILDSCFICVPSVQGANPTKVGNTKIGSRVFVQYCQVAITTTNKIALTFPIWSQIIEMYHVAMLLSAGVRGVIAGWPQTPIAYFCAAWDTQADHVNP